VDLGPLIGSNISFLAERVACKIHVETSTRISIVTRGRAIPSCGKSGVREVLFRKPAEARALVCFLRPRAGARISS